MGTTTTIRITARAKQSLERLQAAWAKAHRGKATQQEVAERAFRFLERHPDEFVREGGWKPLDEAGWRWMESLQSDMGDWSVTDIDEIVYGPRA